jgi:hypothetical protein
MFSSAPKDPALLPFFTTEKNCATRVFAPLDVFVKSFSHVYFCWAKKSERQRNEKQKKVGKL